MCPRHEVVWCQSIILHSELQSDGSPTRGFKKNEMRISSLFSSQRPNDDGQREGGDRGGTDRDLTVKCITER